MRKTLKPVVICAALLWAVGASAQTSKRDVEMTAVDGVKIKATSHSAGKPGPGVLLPHQCNRDHKSWDDMSHLRPRKCRLRN